MLTAPPRRAMRFGPRLWRCLDAIGAIGAPAVGAAGAVALGAAGAAAFGVIGACAHAAGAAIARAAAIATPFKRCFMPLSSVAVLDWTIRCNGLLHPRGDPRASGRKQPSCCSVPADTQLLASRIRPRR